MIRDPANGGDADRIAKAEQGLIERYIDLEFAGTHQAGALAGCQEANGKALLPGGEKDLSPTATARGAKATGDAINAQFRH